MHASAEAAFEYGYPLTETMRVCDLFPFVNWLHRSQKLNTAADTAVVRPNNDTLYTTACVYLGAGWVTVKLPPAGDRYMSMQIFDAYTTTAALRGPSQVPAAGGSYVLHLRGARTAGLPDGAEVIEVETPYAFALFRTLVNGPADLAAAVAAQQGIELTASAHDQPTRPAAVEAQSPGDKFFYTLMQRLAQNPPPATDAALIASFAAAGIRPSLTPAAAPPTPAQRAAWDHAYTTGLAKLSNDAELLHAVRGTWSFPDPQIATPGTNYALRARTARWGLFALPPSESIYPSTRGDGTTGHVLQLPGHWPPIDRRGFWSLTMYDTHGFLVNNPIERYAISDRTPGIQREPDGSLKIYIQCSDPGGARSANWLPAPCGPFTLTLRLYLPTAEARSPSFLVPPLN